MVERVLWLWLLFVVLGCVCACDSVFKVFVLCALLFVVVVVCALVCVAFVDWFCFVVLVCCGCGLFRCCIVCC